MAALDKLEIILDVVDAGKQHTGRSTTRLRLSLKHKLFPPSPDFRRVSLRESSTVTMIMLLMGSRFGRSIVYRF